MWLYALILASFIGSVALLVGVALLARRLHLPVVAVTVAAGAVFGVGLEWFWGAGYGDADYFYNLVPALLGSLINQVAWEAFNPKYSHLPAGEGDATPWLLQLPQVKFIVSGVFWGLIGFVAGLWVRRRPRPAAR